MAINPLDFAIPNGCGSNWDLLFGSLPLLACDYFLHQHIGAKRRSK